MSLTQFDNSIIPVLVGMARVPELEEHQILIRHVVHDLELGQFERAIQTLDNAHRVFELSSLIDLKRFIEEQTDSISREVSTPAWKTVVRVINGSTNRWIELTNGASLSDLLYRCRSLAPEIMNAQTPIPTDAYETTNSPPLIEGSVRDTVTESTEQYPPARPMVRDTTTQAPTEQRVNVRAAIITFFVVLMVAGLFSLASY